MLVRETLSRGHAVGACERLFFGKDGLAGVENQIELEIEDVRTVSLRQFEVIRCMIQFSDGRPERCS